LGGKKTRGDLLTTWLNIEAAIINQTSQIRTEANSERDRTPLYVDRKAFRGVFGVVTWHACRKVQDHYDTTKRPYKECTGTFTKVMGLPCAHLYDRRRDTGGFIPEDFHRHWF
jgi:hypothetical protein